MNPFQKRIQKFCQDRDWNQFHNPKDLLLGIVEEVGEIRNLVKWEQDPQKLHQALLDNKAEFEDDIGDIYWFLALLANSVSIDIDTAISKVLNKNTVRFPIHQTRARHTNAKIGGHDGHHT